MKLLIRIISRIVFSFIFISSLVYAEPVYALNTGDYCGEYQSGPHECVVSCKVMDAADGSQYCANNETGYCTTPDNNCYIQKPASMAIGCYGVAYASIDCAHTALYLCNTITPFKYEIKGCDYLPNPTPTPIPEPSCRIYLTPVTTTVDVGSTVSFSASVTNIENGDMQGVTFTSSNTSRATVNPASDIRSPYGTTVTGVSAGTVTITARAIMDGDPTCSDTSTVTVNQAPSCTLSLTPATATISQGHTLTALATVSNILNGTVSNVAFSSTSRATVNPASDTSSPYTTTVTGTTVGAATVTAGAYMGGSMVCSDTSAITIVPSDPWWQVVDADVVSAGNLTSKVPSSYLFDLVGSGGFPGVVIYSGSTNLTADTVSEKQWLAASSIALSKTFNSTYFFNSLPGDIVVNEIGNPNIAGSYFASGGASYNGYYYYLYDATSIGLPLNITSAMSLGGRKVILLVKGAGINFGSTVNLTKGSGFFLAVSTGDMNVLSSVGGSSGYSLEGIYVTDGTFSSGSAGEESDSQLRIRGSVYAYDGMNLQRDLVNPGNATNPAEYFEYAPDLELLFPVTLAYRPTRWLEVAP